jgi:hypothetical protein
MHIDDRVEVVVAHFPEHAIAQDARVGHHDVQLAELLNRFPDKEISDLRRADRGHRGDGPAAGFDDSLDDLGSSLGVHVVDHDRGPGLRQRLGVGAAKPSARTCHDGNFPRQIHSGPLVSARPKYVTLMTAVN